MKKVPYNKLMQKKQQMVFRKMDTTSKTFSQVTSEFVTNYWPSLRDFY